MMPLEVCYKAVNKIEEGWSSFEVTDLEANPSPQGEQHPFEHAKDGFLAKGHTASLQRRHDADVVRRCPRLAAAGEPGRRKHQSKVEGPARILVHGLDDGTPFLYMRRFCPARKQLAAYEQHNLRLVEEFSDKDINFLSRRPLERG